MVLNLKHWIKKIVQSSIKILRQYGSRHNTNKLDFKVGEKTIIERTFKPQLFEYCLVSLKSILQTCGWKICEAKSLRMNSRAVYSVLIALFFMSAVLCDVSHLGN